MELHLTSGEAIERANEAADRLATYVIDLNNRVEADPGVIPSASKEQLVPYFASVILSAMMDRYLIVPNNGAGE